MFSDGSIFNQDISNWNIQNVLDMSFMFSNNASFNQDISGWNTTQVSDMTGMFQNASSFNQNIGNWNIVNASILGILPNSGLDRLNYDATLAGWDALGATGKFLFATGLKYCNSESNRQNMIDNKGWTITGDALDCSMLPVEFVSFAGQSVNNTVRLSWQTATEINNAGFDIQKSKSGTGDWQTIGFKEGRANTDTATNYDFTDENPFVGTNYYRLKQTDYDGAFEYSKVVTVDYSSQTASFSVAPNPSRGRVNLNLDNPLQADAEVTILDSSGKVVSKNIFNTSETHLTVDIEQQGVYFVSVRIGHRLLRERVVVTE